MGPIQVSHKQRSTIPISPILSTFSPIAGAVLVVAVVQATWSPDPSVLSVTFLLVADQPRRQFQLDRTRRETRRRQPMRGLGDQRISSLLGLETLTKI